jgi:hypothetical protein
MRVTGDPGNQRPDMWSSTVIQNEINLRMDCKQTRKYAAK